MNDKFTVMDLIDQLQSLVDNEVSAGTLVVSRGSASNMVEDDLSVRVTRTKSGKVAVYVGPSKAAYAATSDTVAGSFTLTNESTAPMVNSSKPFSSVDYVYGMDVSTASTNSLISALNRVNDEIKSLQSVDAASTKLTAMIEDLTSAKAKIVAALDAAK